MISCPITPQAADCVTPDSSRPSKRPPVASHAVFPQHSIPSETAALLIKYGGCGSFGDE